ncbi:hypothetical protein A2U01_0038674 [Trifolium medium]|uniref:Uncharacterized protein n=1 Tax=Trifolium medium TaxID=97028 RepID=A0A392Q1S9_9FABA|nr:hypothetical protein [Trifolium medium]
MASTSGATKRSPSPPQSQPQPQSSPRDPFQPKTNRPPRFEQDLKLIHGFELQEDALKILYLTDCTKILSVVGMMSFSSTLSLAE